MGYLLRTQQARRQFMYGAALVDVVPRLLYHHVRLERNSFLNTSYSRKLFVTSPIPPGSCTRCLFGWCLCRADGVIASRYSDSAGSGRGVCFEAVWRPEYCGLLLRRGSCERRRLSCGLRDGGDAGRPCALHLPKQWLRNQARTPRVPSQA